MILTETTVVQSAKILGLYDVTSEKEIYKAYLNTLNSLSRIIPKPKIESAKTTLLYNILVKRNKKEPKNETIRKELLFRGACESCRGWGIKEKIEKEICKVPCPACNKTCWQCKGKGKVYTQNEHGKFVASKCMRCNGTGIKKLKKCYRCSIRGKPQRFLEKVIAYYVVGYEICPSCSGSGKKETWNPALSKEQAESIKNRLFL